MEVIDLLRKCAFLGIRLEAGDNGALQVNPMRALADDLKAALKVHKPVLLKLLTAPPADFLGDDPCPVCGSHERWNWFDDQALCRVCTVLDLAPLTLVRQGWDRPTRQEEVAS
jgi:hypothetical protein